MHVHDTVPNLTRFLVHPRVDPRVRLFNLLLNLSLNLGDERWVRGFHAVVDLGQALLGAFGASHRSLASFDRAEDIRGGEVAFAHVDDFEKLRVHRLGVVGANLLTGDAFEVRAGVRAVQVAEHELHLLHVDAPRPHVLDGREPHTRGGFFVLDELVQNQSPGSAVAALKGARERGHAREHAEHHREHLPRVQHVVEGHGEELIDGDGLDLRRRGGRGKIGGVVAQATDARREDAAAPFERLRVPAPEAHRLVPRVLHLAPVAVVPSQPDAALARVLHQRAVVKHGILVRRAWGRIARGNLSTFTRGWADVTEL